MLLKGKDKMEKVIRYIIHNRKEIIRTIAIGVVASIAYELSDMAGAAERGFEAVGGGIFIPLLIIFAPQIWETIKAPFEVLKEQENK